MLESCKDSAPVAISQKDAMASYGTGTTEVKSYPAIQILHGRGEYAATIGCFPAHWRPFLRQIPWFATRKGDLTRLAGIAVAAVDRRLSRDATGPGDLGTDRRDLLTNLCEVRDEEGNKMEVGELTAEVLTQMTAGSDTMAKSVTFPDLLPACYLTFLF